MTHQHRFIKGRSLGRRAAALRQRVADERRRAAQPPAAAYSARLSSRAAVGVCRRDDDARRRAARRWKRETRWISPAKWASLTLAIAGRILFGADRGRRAAEIGDALETATSLLEVAVLPFAALCRSVCRCLTCDDSAPRGRRSIARFPASSNRRRRTGGDTGDLLSLLLVGAGRGDGEENVGSAASRRADDDAAGRATKRPQTLSHGRGICWPGTPEVEARLHAEIDRTLGRASSDGRRCAGVALPRMVLAEAMRSVSAGLAARPCGRRGSRRPRLRSCPRDRWWC